MTLLLVGWGLPAQAQPTNFSLPPLPNFPASPDTTNARPPIPSAPVQPNPGTEKVKQSGVEKGDAPLAIPELAGLPLPPAPPNAGAKTTTTTTTTTVPDKVEAAATSTTSPPPAVLPDAATTAPSTETATTTTTTSTDTSSPPTEQSDQTAQQTQAAAAGAPSPLDVAAPPSTLPGLSLPPPPGTTDLAPSSGQASSGGATSLPEVNVTAATPARRTWETVLAPAIVPPKTNFNYRRQILPDAIYRKQYDRENMHLPVAYTQQDYARLLIDRVAANDIDATRALLNTGLPVNTVDGSGQTLLSIARRYHADDTARLLMARGAQG